MRARANLMALREHVVAVDIEAASGEDITQGATAYATHPSTRAYCAVFGFPSGPGDYEYVRWHPGERVPHRVSGHISNGGLLLAHNAGFERAMFKHILTPRHRFPDIAVRQWRDTQAVGLFLNLPKSLDGLASVLGCGVQKDKEGSALMLSMCRAIPHPDYPDQWVYPNNTAENRERLALYCQHDVGATLDAWFAMTPLPPEELELWLIDQEVNARGVYLSRSFAAVCSSLARQRQAELGTLALAASGGEVSNATATPWLKDWLESKGVELPMVARKKSDGTFHKTPSCDQHAVRRWLQDPELPPVVRDVLEIRTEANKATSLAKLHRVATMVGPDGRLRDALQYCGAHTARWTSSGFQLHNLPKDKLGEDGRMSDAAYGLAVLGDLDVFKMVFDKPLEVLSQLLRSVVEAAPGHDIIAGDYAAVEARVLTWLVDDVDLLHVFESGQDVYVHTAALMGLTCAHTWSKSCPSCVLARAIGKVCRLALGYGMGALKLADTGGKSGVTMGLKEWRNIQVGWRKSNPLVVEFWRALEDTFKEAIGKPGQLLRVGRIGMLMQGPCLSVLLPSGRSIRYWRPRIVDAEKRIRVIEEDGSIVERVFEAEEIQFYMPSGNRMKLESTYGGKLAENVTQAVSRDLLRDSMRAIDPVDPYKIVMHVHDSIATEVPSGCGSVSEFCELMARRPTWAPTLPVAVEGYRAPRFRG